MDYIVISYNFKGGNSVRKLVLIFTFVFLSTILLRYTTILACPNNRLMQDYLNNYKKTWNSSPNKKDDSLDKDKKDSPKSKSHNSSMNSKKEEAFVNHFNNWHPQSPKDDYDFGQLSSDNIKWNNIESFENESLISKASDVKKELGKTKKLLNDVENKAKNQINLEIKKSKSLIDEVVQDKDLDFKTKKQKISKIKRNLSKKVKKIEDGVVEEAKAILEQQYEKTDLLLGSVNP